MGQGVLDQQSGTNVFYPDDVSSDTVEKSMQDFIQGAIKESKPDWYTQYIKERLQKMGASIYDPVMTARSFIGGVEKGIQPIVPFKISPTPTEQEAFKSESPIANTLGQFGGMGAAAGALQVATGGIIDAAAPFLAKVPALASLVAKMTSLKEASGVARAVAKTGEGVAMGGTVFGEYGGLQSVSQQKDTYGNVDWHQTTMDTLKNAGMGFVAGGVMSYIAKPLAEMGTLQELMEQVGKRMVASGAVMGGMTAAGGGSKRDIMLATAIGALYAGVDAHGEFEGVNRATIDELNSLKARYLLSQTGGDETAVTQVSTEHTQNQAEEAINESNAGILERNPTVAPLKERQEGPGAILMRSASQMEQFRARQAKIAGEPKVPVQFNDPYAPAMLDYLAQYIPAKAVALMDGEERLAYANGPWQDLRDLSLKYDSGELSTERPILNDRSTIKQDPNDIERDADAARGIARNKNVLDEVSSSKELTQNLLAKTANELTGEMKQSKETSLSDRSNTEKAPIENKVVENKEVEKPKNQEVKGGEEKVAKASEDISQELVKRGMEELSDEDKATFTSVSKKDQLEKVAELIRTDPQRAERIANSEEDMPSDIHGQVLYNAVKMKAIDEKNMELITKLADSPLAKERSLAAQTLSGAGFNNGFEHDPVNIIRDVNKAKESETKKAEPLLKKVRASVKASAPRLSDWQKFIQERAC